MATTMPSLPQPAPASPKGRDPLSTILMVGTSLFGGGTAVYLLLQLVREQPDQAFKLLQAWGPGYLLALFIAFALNKLLSKAVDMFAQSGATTAAAISQVATQMQSIAEATSRQALALQTTADKDDRDKQEMQILIGVVNSKVEQASADLKLHGKAIEATLDEIKRQNRALMRIEDALKINRPEESETK